MERALYQNSSRILTGFLVFFFFNCEPLAQVPTFWHLVVSDVQLSPHRPFLLRRTCYFVANAHQMNRWYKPNDLRIMLEQAIRVPCISLNPFQVSVRTSTGSHEARIWKEDERRRYWNKSRYVPTWRNKQWNNKTDLIAGRPIPVTVLSKV